MNAKNHFFQIRKILSGFMILGIVIGSLGTTNITPAHAQGAVTSSPEKAQVMSDDPIVLEQRTRALQIKPENVDQAQLNQQGLPTNRIIVKYKSTASAFSNPRRASQMDRVNNAAGITMKYLRAMSGDAHVLQLPERLPLERVQAISERLMTLPEVQYAEPDRIFTATLTPNDPLYANQWHYSGTWGINAPAAWDITTGASNIVMAVIDTGITNHADLSGRTVPGYDFITDVWMANDGNARDNNPSDPGDWVAANDCYSGSAASDSSWHGTHVAGTMGAASNNGLGVAGVNWNSMILPVRVLGKCGGYSSDIVDGIRWAAGLPVSGVPNNPNPAKVLNISLGGYGFCDTTYQSAVDSITAVGSVVVVAAGNNNDNASEYAPGNCNGVITVAAIAGDGWRASYSNYGSVVEIAAPGGDAGYDPMVLSTLNTGTTVPVADTYGNYQGTSMATPHVSGVVSLMFSLNPNLTPAQVLQILQGTARPFLSGGGCTTSLCGAGVIDAGAAVNAVPPDITGFSPGSGVVGTSVTISGLNFAQASAVRFNGTNASFSIASATSITATVPAGATTGPIAVTNPGGTATSASNFVVLTPPGSFGKSSPANGAGGQATSLSLTWEASAGATSYEYCYDTSNDNACSSWTSNGNSTSKALSGLSATTTYYWHVRAINSGGTTYSNGNSTAFWSFTTAENPPGAFNKSSPANGAADQPTNPTLVWSASTGATSYEYCYDTSNDNACSSWTSNGTSTIKALSGLSAGITYYWHVRAVNSGGTTYSNGSSTAFWSFTTAPDPPGAFNKSAPADGATVQSTSLTLSWNASAGATSYEYCYDTTNDNACSSWTSNGTSTTKALSGLSADTTYYWHVRASNSGGTTYANDSATAFWSFTTATAPGLGVYDDMDSNWLYTGTWSIYSGAGPYNNTNHYTNVVGNEAQIAFNGNKFTLTYVKASNRGLIDVYLDGTKIQTINANSSTLAWQQSWTSPVLTAGTHTVRFVHAGGGTYIDIDAIQIYAPLDWVAPAAISNLSAATGTTGGTVTLTWTAPGDDGTTGTASSYLVRYSSSVIDTETAWNAATPVTSGIPAPAVAGSAQSMTVSGLTPDATYYFAVRAQDEEPNLGGLSNSPSAIPQNPTPITGGKYDDFNSNWVYSGAWTTYSGAGPYNNTSHYANTVGSQAWITFTGTQFTLTYVKASNRGLIDVYLDGTKIQTINANSSTLAWQQTWTSPVLTSAVHTVRFVHAGGGTYVDIDAITIVP